MCRDGAMNKALRTLAAIAIGSLVVSLCAILAMGVSKPPSVLQAIESGTAQTPEGLLPAAHMEISIWPDSMQGMHGANGGAHPDFVSYGPTSHFQVPAHSVVTITFKQYDSGEKIWNPYFSKVHGTVDGTMTLDGKKVSGINPNAVGHTFTVHGMNTGQPDMFLSIPLPPTDENAEPQSNGYVKPHIITATFITGDAGQYIWNCEYPCGDGSYAKFGNAMSTGGYMSGIFDVVDANA